MFVCRQIGVCTAEAAIEWGTTMRAFACRGGNASTRRREPVDPTRAKPFLPLRSVVGVYDISDGGAGGFFGKETA